MLSAASLGAGARHKVPTAAADAGFGHHTKRVAGLPLPLDRRAAPSGGRARSASLAGECPDNAMTVRSFAVREVELAVAHSRRLAPRPDGHPLGIELQLNRHRHSGPGRRAAGAW